MELIDHIHKLKHFIKVVEAGSIKGGSEKAYLTQPNMTKIIQQLEEACGSQLLVRSKSGVELTRSGFELYQLALKTVEDVNNYIQNINLNDKPITSLIRIGTYDSIARYFFPSFLEYFESRHPKSKLKLKTARSAQIASELLDHKIDVGIIINANDYPGLVIHNAFTDTFGLYVSNNIRKLSTERLLYFEFSLNNIEKSIKKFSFYDYFCCDNLETVKSLTEQGLGIGLLPHRVARDGVLSGRLIPFRHPKIKINLFDEHSIDVCFSTKIQNESLVLFKNELLTFLKIWSKK